MTSPEQLPRKRWNQRGSVHAKRRMAELRAAKLGHEKSRLIVEWARVTGRPAAEWWQAAQCAGLQPGCGTAASIAFLHSAIAEVAR